MESLWIVVAHRQCRAPSQRFRLEPYEQALRERGIQTHWLPLMSEADDKRFYAAASTFDKASLLFQLFIKRTKQLHAIPNGSRVLIHREAFPLGGAFFERELKRRNCRLIYDFDDAIWLADTSEANRKWAFLKSPQKFHDICGMANLVFAGNDYLANAARKHASRVEILPTPVDTDTYKRNSPRNSDNNRPVIIGWTGSPTTVAHFRHAIPALLKIKAKYGKKVDVQLIGDENVRIPELSMIGESWSEAAEHAALARFDIGLMPLPDSPWTHGKCGLKALTYMAYETPAIASPVGVNSKIISEGANGFLAETDQEWIDKLSRLIEDADLRHRLGKQARQDVEDKWSVRAWAAAFVEGLLSV